MTKLDISPTLAPDAFTELVRFLSQTSALMGVVLRVPEVRLERSARRVIEELAPALHGVTAVTEWPGTRTISQRTATRHLYRSGEVVARVILENSAGFGDWVNPTLPEDIHFLRSDGSVLMGSVAQHEAAWMELSNDEEAALVARFPALLGRLSAQTRPLSDLERHVLQGMADEWAATAGPVSEALRVQVMRSRAVDRETDPVQVVVSEDAPPLPLADGALPWEAVVLGDGQREKGSARVWVSEGRILQLEWSWWSKPPESTARLSVRIRSRPARG